MRIGGLALIVGLASCAEASMDDVVVDAPSVIDVDAGVDAAVDGAADATPCLPRSVELLVNGDFDDAEHGRGWTETGAAGSLITKDASAAAPAANTAPYRVWLGGRNNATERLYQDIAIPADASVLVVTGQVEVRTAEPGTLPRDQARLTLRDERDELLETLATWDNRHPTTGWTALSETVTGNYPGRTLRLALDDVTDGAAVSSFFVDSLSVTATTICR